MKKGVYKKTLLHHRYKFGFRQNIKVWFCRKFGHRINNNVEHKWCNSCGLFYGEIYHKHDNWEKHI